MMLAAQRKIITLNGLVLFVCFAVAANAEQYSWQIPYAKVTPEGDLQWNPQPFVFKAGESVHYIDYDKGSDDNPGTKEKPWKHHPWDSAATGKAAGCSGIHTYVFKRGVIYRGALVAKESGKPGDPIRLTSDPSWGQGEAAIYSSARITDGWKHCDANAALKFPDAEKVWYKDIGSDFAPRALWEVRDGKIIRIPLARTPNWKESNPDDVKSEWYLWEDANLVREQQRAWCIDSKHLTASDPNAYDGVTVWTEYSSVMGTPYMTPIEGYDPQRQAVRLGGPWGQAQSNYCPIKFCRYFLENLPQFLDGPGEYYFDVNGPPPSRLYIRLPDDRNPNQATIEAARYICAIDIRNQSNIEITGLVFRFGNTIYEIERFWVIDDQDATCIRILGACNDIRVSNCKFEHAMLAVRASAKGLMDNIAVTDNEILYTDHGALEFAHGGGRETLEGELRRIKVLNNRLFHIGSRPMRAQHGHAVVSDFPTLAEVAGNVLDRCYGAGLFIFGGKGGGNLYDKPLARILIHHNKVTDPLLNTNDWGGIESWQGGPTYIFDNISGNPGGYWHWKHLLNKNNPNREHTTARFGFAYYCDGAFKQYLFNNIAWGKSNDLNSPLCNTAALQEIIGFQNTAFNNTFYKFAAGSRRQVPQAGRNCYLGNLWMDISEMYFRHSDAEAKDENVHQLAGSARRGEPYAEDTLAYADNVFFGKPRHFGLFESDGILRNTLETYRAALEQKKSLSWQTGWEANSSPVRNAEAHDFRPVAGSSVIDRGVKVFVPWALCGVVGEWHFYKNNAEPNKILDEHWFMTEEFLNRDMYRFVPHNDLTVHNVTLADYSAGTLEDWTDGALNFNGKDRFCSISETEMKRPFTIRQRRGESRTVEGDKRKTLDMGTNNFLIEVYFKTQSGHKTSCLVSKLDTAGYTLDIDKDGHARLALLTAAQVGNECSRVSSVKVNDDKWHHLIAEVDRSDQVMNIYVDGKLANGVFAGKMPAADGSLSNAADFLVGKGAKGGFFAGAIDFLRVSRGTLADAQTTIDELYAWEFAGPHLKDFFGNAPAAAKRDAGAIEYISH